MAVRCIPMKRESVNNVLEGRMTQTRRFANYGEEGDFLLVKESFGVTESGNIVYDAGMHVDGSIVEWHSGRHMRREQCRILLQIVNKWIEPIFDISEADAIAVSGSREKFVRSVYRNFSKILLDSNPLVTAYEFKVITLSGGLRAFEAGRGPRLGNGPGPGPNASEGPP